jgi:hypothetical protein
MTPQEQIAIVRLRNAYTSDGFTDPPSNAQLVLASNAQLVLAVCDLAERALLTDDEAEVVESDLDGAFGAAMSSATRAVLRRLLPDERVEHRLTFIDNLYVRCSCGQGFGAMDTTTVIRNAAAHAGVGGTE